MTANSPSSNQLGDDQVCVELISQVEDFERCFYIVCEAFGRQTNDAIWVGLNPGWDSPAGKQVGVRRLVKRFLGTKQNQDDKPNTIFLKATVPDPHHEGGRVIAGIAIWQQLSVVEGFGDPLPSDLRQDLGVEEMYPDDEPEQRFLVQVLESLHRRRHEVVKEKATEQPPAVLVLDLCAVDPAFQRRGIAGKLVQFGLDEAKRRGGLEATTEASSMGRGAYMKLGFRPERPDIVYDVDREFAGRKLPPNLFLRTGSL